MQSTARSILCLLGIGGLLISTSFAQPQSPPVSDKAPVSAKSKPYRVPTPSEELVSFEFGGGTIQSFVETLRVAMNPTPLNVFIEPEAANQIIPPVKFTDVSYYQVLRLLDRTATDEKGRRSQTQLEQSNTPVDSAPMFKIRAIPMGGGFAKGFSVLSLNPIIGLPGSSKSANSGLDAKTVLAAVEAAVVAAEEPGATPPILKFHETSGLLFVRGTDAQREAAGEVVQQLRRDVEADRAADLAATAGRSTQKVLLKSEVPDDLAQRLRKLFAGQCCLQFEVDGKYLIVTGDRELVNEAAKLAYINDQAAIQRKEKEATKK